MESSRETTVLFALLIGGEELYARAGDKEAHDAIEHCQFRLGRAAASCGGRLGWIALGQPRAEAKEIVEFFCGPAPVRPPLPK